MESRRIRTFLFAFLTAALSVAAAPFARAQEQTPGFNLPGIITPEEVTDLSVDFNESFDAIENPYLADTIKLNYQISLLEKMVSRQAEVGKISEAYASLGIPFTPPPPPRGICAQLPANAPCLAAYPDLYGGLVASRKAHYDEIAAKQRAAEAGAIGIKPGESDEAARKRRDAEEAKRKAAEEAKRAAVERKDRFRWTEVTCLSDQCRVVLTKPAEKGYRATVREGSHLPDGVVVKTITPQSVQVAIDGDMINVQPAPTSDGSTKKGGPDNRNVMAESLRAAGVSATGAELNPPVGAGSPGMNNVKSAADAAIGSLPSNGGGTPSGGSTGSSAIGGPPIQSAGGPVSSGVSPATAPGGTAAGQTVSEPALGPSGLF